MVNSGVAQDAWDAQELCVLTAGVAAKTGAGEVWPPMIRMTLPVPMLFDVQDLIFRSEAQAGVADHGSTAATSLKVVQRGMAGVGGSLGQNQIAPQLPALVAE